MCQNMNFTLITSPSSIASSLANSEMGEKSQNKPFDFLFKDHLTPFFPLDLHYNIMFARFLSPCQFCLLWKAKPDSHPRYESCHNSLLTCEVLVSLEFIRTSLRLSVFLNNQFGNYFVFVLLISLEVVICIFVHCNWKQKFLLW